MDEVFHNFSPTKFTNRILRRNKRLGADACEMLAKSVQAVDPYECVSNQIHFDDQVLLVSKKMISIDRFDRIFLIGFGKAAVPMAKALLDKLGEKIFQASVITKDEKFLANQGYHDKLIIYLGGHPLPTEQSVESTRMLLNSLPTLTEKDLVLVVISGGGSALCTDPVGMISLDDLKNLTQVLINCSANITEINTIRKHLDQVKGGRLAVKLMPAFVHSLILSDVIGDRLDMIASGPTAPDLTTFDDAINILFKYDIIEDIPESIFKVLKKGKAGEIEETLKPGCLPAGRVEHHLVGTNFLALEAARRHALTLGYNAAIITTHLSGRTDQVVNFINGILQTQLIYGQPLDKPACLIFGGETTVNVSGSGLGGRNMDLAMRMAHKLAGNQGVIFVSFATDGDDGPTDAAGAVTDGLMLNEGKDLFGLSIESYIENNDSYHYLERHGALIKTGATGTNVNDIIIMLIDS